MQLDRRWASATLAALGISVVGSMLAVGTVHAHTVLLVMPLAILSGGLVIARQGLRELLGPAGVLIALAGYSLLQAVPLPVGVLARLDPATLAIWRGALQPLGESPAWVTLSLDPGATRLEALKWLGYAGVFIAAAALTRERDGRWVPMLIFGSALLAAVVTLLHRLAGAEAVFGLYRPVYASPRFAVGPLLNPNNLAGYLNLGVFCGVASMVARRQLLPSWVFGLGVAVIIAISTVGGSRAGVVSLAAGGLATIFCLGYLKFEGRRLPRTMLGATALAMLGGLALFALGANRSTWQALLEEGMRKLALIGWTKSLVAEHLWFGVGRGAFETAFPAYRADVGHHIYQFAENFVMQWCCEWGVPVTVAALGTLAWLLRSAIWGRSMPSTLVCSIGVLVLLVHNLLDLGLELASVGIALFALVGSLWGAHARVRGTREPGTEARWPAFVLGGFALSGWVISCLTGRWSAIEDRRALSAEYRALRAADPDRVKDLRPRVREAIYRHPADPFFPLIGALAARAAGESPLPWLARAIERDPMAGRPYLMLAQVLAGRGASGQALLSLRMAVEREYGLVKHATDLAVLISRDAEALKGAAPKGPGGAGLLTALATREDMAANRTSFLETAIERDARAIRPRELLAQDLLAAMQRREPPCDTATLAACAGRARELAARIETLDPRSDAPLILQARLLAEEGRSADGLRRLELGCPVLDEPAACFRWLVVLAEQARDVAALERGAEAYLSNTCERPAACAAAASWLGERYERLGQGAKAIRMFERAAEESGSADAWLRVARISERLGLASAALRAKNRASRSTANGTPAPTSAPRDDDLLRKLLED